MCQFLSNIACALYIFYIAKAMLHIISWSKATFQIVFEKAGYKCIVKDEFNSQEAIFGLFSPLAFKLFARRLANIIKAKDPVFIIFSLLFKLLQKIAQADCSFHGETPPRLALESDHRNETKVTVFQASRGLSAFSSNENLAKIPGRWLPDKDANICCIPTYNSNLFSFAEQELGDTNVWFWFFFVVHFDSLIRSVTDALYLSRNAFFWIWCIMDALDSTCNGTYRIEANDDNQGVCNSMAENSIQPDLAVDIVPISNHRSRHEHVDFDTLSDSSLIDELAVLDLLEIDDADMEDDDDDEHIPADDDTVVGTQERKSRSNKRIGDVLHEIRDMLQTLRPNTTSIIIVEPYIELDPESRAILEGGDPVAEAPQKKPKRLRRGKKKPKKGLKTDLPPTAKQVGFDDELIVYPKLGSSSTKAECP